MDTHNASAQQTPEQKLKLIHTLRPVAEYHEDFGTVLWWHLPISEPPYVGGGPGDGARLFNGYPTDCQYDHDCGWLTHWSPLPDCRDMVASDGARVGG